jgi:tRNA threonylcarbamoyladenosine biosynthesis protein TsaE
MLLSSPAATLALGERIGAALLPGDVIGLVGDLGAGKTLLVQGIARGLGIPDALPITSPTFTLVHLYKGGRLRLAHVDLYRLERARDLEDIGLDELYREEGAVAVEWIDRFPEELPRELLEIRLTVVGETAREAELIPHGEAGRALLAKLLA